MGFWRRGMSQMERIRNRNLREVMNVQKDIIQEIEKQTLRWYWKRMHGERLPRAATIWEVEGRRKKKNLCIEDEWIKRNMTRRGLQEEEIGKIYIEKNKIIT